MRDFYKIFKIAFILLLLVLTTKAAFGYNQVFPSIKLRYGYGYYFNDTFNNDTNRQYYLQQFNVAFTEQGNYDGGPNPSFRWTSGIQAANYYVAPNTRVKVIESNPDAYYINFKPTARRSDNISIVYDIWNYEKVGANWVDKGRHTEYQPYTITWCGDGVRDDYIDQYTGNKIYETCDPNDLSKSGFGTGGCNQLCEPVTTPTPPICNNISVSPKTGNAPLNTNISCTGTNASSYKIEIKKGATLVQTINSRTGSYNFTNAGDYKVQCFVNNTVTSPNCIEDVKVLPTPPSPSCDNLSVTPQNGLVGLTSSFNCDGTAADSYRVVVSKDGTALRTFNAKSGSYQFTQDGSYQVQCFVNGNLTSNSCKKPVQITKPEPAKKYDLALRKTLVNPKTSYKQGDEVVFEISVFNQGEIEANSVEVVDYIPAGLTLKGTIWSESNNKAKLGFGRIPVGNTKIERITFIVNGTVKGKIINFSEISLDDGNDCDSTPDTTNGNQSGETIATGLIDDAIGNGCNPGGDEDDHDLAEITIDQTVTPVYDLALRKTLSTTSPGPFKKGDSVTFDIEVFNQGNIDANSIVVTDYIPTGLTLNDAAWARVGNIATRTITNIVAGSSKKVSITFKIDNDAPRNIKNLAEISQDDGNDCDSTPDSDPINDGTIVDDDIGNGCNPGGDEDDHDPAVIIVTDGGQTYDLALRKTVSSTTPGPFAIGDSVSFDIEIFNQGNVTANSIEVTDYIPTGFALNDASWTRNGNKATRVISQILAGQSQKVTISFTITADASGDIKNFAEISQDDGNDCDSTPDNINENQAGETPATGLVDDDIGNGCNPGGDEDDHDLATITLPTQEVALCTNLTATPVTGVNSLTTTLNCTGNNASIYKIEVKNSAGNVIQTLNSASGSVTLGSVGNYTASCFINNQTITIPACIKTLSVTTNGGGSENPSCNDIIRVGNTFSCFGNKTTSKFVLQCGTNADGSNKFIGPINSVDTGEAGGRRKADFVCTDSVAPRCFGGGANSNSTDYLTSSQWVTTEQCTIQANPICGDGVVQPERGEQCDFGGTSPYDNWGSCRKPGTPNECTLPSSSSGGGSSSGGSSGSSSGIGTVPDGRGIITIPNDGEIIFGPVGDIIVGHTANPLARNGEYPFIRNNSDYDLSFDALCVKKISGDASLSAGEYCMNIGNDMIYPGETVSLDQDARWRLAYPLYTADKAGIPSGASYGSSVLSTSVKKGPIDYFNAYFAAKLNVRVAKPAVTTVGGGTSYVKDTTTGDIGKVTDGVSGYENNKNFVGNSVSNSGVSSYSDSGSGSTATNSASDDKTKYEGSVDSVTNTTAPTLGTAGFTDFRSYNGLTNVQIITGKNVTLGNIPSVTQATTYIIEGGNLTLTSDITSNKNLAFVVKGGNIIIKDTIKHLDGTYISIPVGGVGGEIVSTGDTSVQLVVNGSLYGDITRLVDSRYYIDARNSSSKMLSVGTIVSFGSSIFHKPAPLVSQFIGEYLDTTKVAQ